MQALPSNHDDEDLQVRKQKELADLYIRNLKDQIYDITRCRRKCEREIRKQIVEVRLVPDHLPISMSDSVRVVRICTGSNSVHFSNIQFRLS